MAGLPAGPPASASLRVLGVVAGDGVGAALSRGTLGLLANESPVGKPPAFGPLADGLSVGGGKLGEPGGLPRFVPAARGLAEGSAGRGGGAAGLSSDSIRPVAAAIPDPPASDLGRDPGKPPGERNGASAAVGVVDAMGATGLVGVVGSPELGMPPARPLAAGLGSGLGGPVLSLAVESAGARRGVGGPAVDPELAPLAAADDRLLARLRSRLLGPELAGSPGLSVPAAARFKLGLGSWLGKPLGGAAAGLETLRRSAAESLAWANRLFGGGKTPATPDWGSSGKGGFWLEAVSARWGPTSVPLLSATAPVGSEVTTW